MRHPKDNLYRGSYMFGDVRFYSGTLKSVTDVVSSWIRHRRKAYVCVAGLHGLSEAYFHPRVLAAYSHADIVVPDGMPVVAVGRLLGHQQTRRIYGPDLFLSLCSEAEKLAYSIVLYGTTDQTIKRLRHTLKYRFPKLLITGSYAPPFGRLTEKEVHTIASYINRRHPHIVFVGLSTPKQELWMSSFRPLLDAHVLVGVGAAFDFVSGSKPQASRLWQQFGIEWLFRLVHEPKRLWRRYVIAGSVFIILLFRGITRAIIQAR